METRFELNIQGTGAIGADQTGVDLAAGDSGVAEGVAVMAVGMEDSVDQVEADLMAEDLVVEVMGVDQEAAGGMEEAQADQVGVGSGPLIDPEEGTGTGREEEEAHLMEGVAAEDLDMGDQEVVGAGIDMRGVQVEEEGMGQMVVAEDTGADHP